MFRGREQPRMKKGSMTQIRILLNYRIRRYFHRRRDCELEAVIPAADAVSSLAGEVQRCESMWAHIRHSYRGAIISCSG